MAPGLETCCKVRNWNFITVEVLLVCGFFSIFIVFSALSALCEAIEKCSKERRRAAGLPVTSCSPVCLYLLIDNTRQAVVRERGAGQLVGWSCERVIRSWKARRA